MTTGNRQLNSLIATIERPSVVYGSLTVIVLVITTFASPLLLMLIDSVFDLTSNQWDRLSNIGQSFSGISALLAAAALIAIAYTANLQARQVQISQLQAIRTLQFETFKLALGDKSLGKAWGLKSDDDSDFTQWRVQIYSNLAVMYLHTGFRAGEMSEAAIRRATGQELFHSEPIRRFWARARTAYWTEYEHDEMGRRFVEVLNEEYDRVVAELQTAETEDPSRSPAGGY